MFKRQCTITLPTDLVVHELIALTNKYCDDYGLIERLTVQSAAKVIINAIYDVLYTHAPFVTEHNTAEEALKELLPWYRDPRHAAYYFPNVFDAAFHSTEQLVTELIDSHAYDVWDVRMLRQLTTHIAYLGDYRVLEWERQNHGSFAQGDVYVADEECPRIRGSLVAMGYYRNLATNAPIRNVSLITGDIVDYYGNIVLTTVDINRGLRIV